MAEVKAACILIQNEEGNILSLYRADGKGYGLPGGKQDPGESFIDTAVRECFEETGNICVVWGDPFIQDRGDFTVATYLAKIVASSEPTHGHEGEVRWVDYKKLIDESDFKEYNTDCFKFFGLI